MCDLVCVVPIQYNKCYGAMPHRRHRGLLQNVDAADDARTALDVLWRGGAGFSWISVADCGGARGVHSRA